MPSQTALPSAPEATEPKPSPQAAGPKEPPKARGPKKLPLIGAADVGTLLGLGALGAVAWLVPPRRWAGFGRLMAPIAMHFVKGRSGLVERIGRIAGRQLDQPAEQIAATIMAHYVERQLPYLRAYRPGGWQPAIKVLGLSNIDAALAQKRGVVLWDSHFAFASLVTKIGLWRSGLKVAHLSHPRHGFSNTRFGMAVLNPILTRVEVGYLTERVVLSLDDSKDALARLGKRLAAGGVVSVRAGPAAKRPLTAPFLNGTLKLGAGAPLLAHKAGAPLLPVFTRRDGADGFVVRIGEPLALPAEAPRAEALQAAARDYTRHLEAQVLRSPGEWIGWTEI